MMCVHVCVCEYASYYIQHVHHDGAGPVPYSTYYKPMGNLPYISSEQGGLIIRTELIYEYAIKRPIPTQELRAEEGVCL